VLAAIDWRSWAIALSSEAICRESSAAWERTGEVAVGDVRTAQLSVTPVMPTVAAATTAEETAPFPLRRRSGPPGLESVTSVSPVGRERRRRHW